MPCVQRPRLSPLRKRFAEAADSFRRAIQLKPDDASALGNLLPPWQPRGVRRSIGLLANAALELHPDDASAYNNLGSVLRDQGRHDEGASRLRGRCGVATGLCRGP